MKVILLQEVENLGGEGEIVSVKNGYGRNYLIPRGLARLATAGSIKAWQEERKQASRKIAQKKGDAEALAAELAGMELVLQAKAGEENRIFGSITSAQIVDALASEGVTVDRRRVELDEDVRMLGVYTASVRIHPEVVAKVKFRVEPEGGAVAAPETAEAEPAAEETAEG
ncbi:MAG: 50S ribosomal protein L9 [Rhodothermales bacterium]|nr:50S ribosomal protein L9 [Rhodothermales bacterium]MBO6779487.1 50S ribosomal protein L9 [Rhodothermales bacterium]